MKFNFKVSKWANLYYFLHNFAECEWPWPYRSMGPISIWKKKFGDFNTQEKEAIEQFKKIYHRHFLKFYLGTPFFEEKNPWKKLGQYLSQKEVEELKNTFLIFEKKFDLIFKNNLNFLKQWKVKLALKLNYHQSLNKKIGEIFSSLFKINLHYQEFDIFLLMGSDTESNFEKYNSGAGGERGRGLKDRNILLELHIKCPFKKLDYVTGVILHEVIHYCIHKFSLQKSIAKLLKNDLTADFFSEVIIRSFLPIGILGIRFFNAPVPLSLNPFKKSRLPEIDLEQTISILNLTDFYIQHNKKLDEYYVKEIIKILSKKKRWATFLKVAH